MSEKKTQADSNWSKFHQNKSKTNYPTWPNEVMVKTLFGSYLADRVKLESGMKVLDIGCGFGNNLLPFLNMGCDCYGVEVTSDIAELTQGILKERGYSATIKQGKNSALPFENGFFDLIVSLNVLHYEKTEAEISSALKEYNRVLKKGGRLFLMTVGPEHAINKRAKVIGPHRYEIQDYDFRNGEQYFYFDNLKYLNHYLSESFTGIELGRVREQLMTLDLDFLIAAARPLK